jgi:hypothetical protein
MTVEKLEQKTSPVELTHFCNQTENMSALTCHDFATLKVTLP